ncbi:MAG: type II toxin-antitoxin system YafQ family toxin [Bacillota bacterium]|jgi:mRNA interferase YafQ
MRTPIFTNKFQKELKKCKSRGLNINEIGDIMAKLIEDEPLEARNKNHPLSGDFSGCYECHIRPDWLLVYMLDNEANTVTFLRTGTHSDLF